MIWAQDRNRILGSGSEMLWHVPADFQFFKSCTWGCPILMGRKSFQALGRALPGRTNVVITRDLDFDAPDATVTHSLEQALAVARQVSDNIWITGGASIYRQAMPLADELVVTCLDLDVSDRSDELVYAPSIDEESFAHDASRSDQDWRARSGQARWRVDYWVRREPTRNGE